MSKVFRAVVGIGLIVVGVFMGGSTWPLAVMALGGGIAASALQPKINMPSVSSATAGRLNKSLEPEAFRKIPYGRTALGTDTRYWEVFGPDQKNYHEVIALAGCKITSFDALYIEDELVTFDGSGNAIGKYAGALSRVVSLEGVSGTTLSGIGTGTRWNVSAGQAASMTGIAHIGLRWTWSQEKLPRGFPDRITLVGKGALVYDPRRDSTRGGSGSHRATTNPGDQSTWEYTPTDSNGEPIGRNPALQIMQYLLGWYIWNPVDEEWTLAHGMGADPDDIDFASFIQAANDCEAEGYYADCLLSTGDTHATNLAVLEQACAGKVSDVGGLYGLRIQVDDFGGSIIEFTDSDIVGECDWRPEMPLGQSSYNQIAGQFIDPAALYQLRPLPLVRDAAYEAADGDKSRTNVRLDAVQDGEQGQKLLRLMLNQSRRKGLFEAPFGWSAVNVRAGQPVKLTLSRFGFSERYFRVRAQKTDPGGAVWMALDDDDPSVYAGGTVLPVAAPGAGAGYDPLSVPQPSLDDWSVAGGFIGNPGFVQSPAITITGDASALTGVVSIVVDHRADGDAVWINHGEFPLTGFEREQILGLLPGAEYEVRLRYRNARGVIDDAQARVFEDVTTGAQVVQSALDAAAGSALDQRITEAEGLFAEIDVEVFGVPSLLNWIEDPEFTTGDAGWVAEGNAAVTIVQDTPRRLRAEWITQGSFLFPVSRPVAEGITVQAGVDVWTDPTLSAVALRARFTNAEGALVNELDLDQGSSGRLEGVIETPAGAASVRFLLKPAGDTGWIEIARPRASYALPGQVTPDAYQPALSETIARIARRDVQQAQRVTIEETLIAENLQNKASIQVVSEAVITESESRAAVVAQMQAQINVLSDPENLDLSGFSTITYVDNVVASEAGTRAQQLSQAETTFQQSIAATEAALQTQIDARATTTALSTAVSDAAGARATLGNQLTASFDQSLANTEAALQTQINARATNTALSTAITNEQQARATDVSNLQVSVNNVEGSIASVSDVAVDAQGKVNALHGVRINANGVITGYGLAVSGTESEFAVAADRFLIVNPSNNAQKTSPFGVIGGITYIVNARIGNAQIDDLTVNKLTGGNLGADVIIDGELNMGSGRIVFDNGVYMKVQGIAFGQNADLMEWFGLKRPIGQMNKSNATTYLGTDGSAYFGGTISAGIITNSGQTTNTQANAEIIVGPFSTNGGPKVVTHSYSFEMGVSGQRGSNEISNPGNPSATLILERRITGGSWTTIATRAVAGSAFVSAGLFDLNGNELWGQQSTLADSWTWTDTEFGTQDREYRLRLTSRGAPIYDPGTGGFANAPVLTQNLSIISVEQ